MHKLLFFIRVDLTLFRLALPILVFLLLVVVADEVAFELVLTRATGIVLHAAVFGHIVSSMVVAPQLLLFITSILLLLDKGLLGRALGAAELKVVTNVLAAT